MIVRARTAWRLAISAVTSSDSTSLVDARAAAQAASAFCSAASAEASLRVNASCTAASLKAG